MLVDISHVSPETMADVLRVSQAPVIASHSSAFAIAPSPRNVPDEILTPAREERRRRDGQLLLRLRRRRGRPRPGRGPPHPPGRAPRPATSIARAYAAWSRQHKMPRGTIADVADHIDHIVKVAGIDHVGIGSDFDGITSWPVGLEDVSCYPRLTEELSPRLHRGRRPQDPRPQRPPRPPRGGRGRRAAPQDDGSRKSISRQAREESIESLAMETLAKQSIELEDQECWDDSPHASRR